MAKKKISNAEVEAIKDAIIDALETNDEVVADDAAVEEVSPEVADAEVADAEVADAEVVKAEEAAPLAGHYSRDFSA